MASTKAERLERYLVLRVGLSTPEADRVIEYINELVGQRRRRRPPANVIVMEFSTGKLQGRKVGYGDGSAS